MSKEMNATGGGGVISMQDAIRQKMGLLRRRFPNVQNMRQLDKDLTHPTADRSLSDIRDRAFFVGEIFWVERAGWSNCGGFSTNANLAHHPGLVVIKQRPFYPVNMVPGTTHPWDRLEDGSWAVNFSPEGDLAWSTPPEDRPKTQSFVLNYLRPVSRIHISWHLATLQYADRARLQRIMEIAHGANWRQQHNL